MSNNKTTDTPSLFSDAEMDALDVHRDEGSVVCLGREFENDEARREFFRDELRRRLPELRQIEGFPIGTDDDIIRLSDPPYYTACPNPWLNDFIREWEDEKAELEREGKRDKRFRVSEPYAYGIKQGKNSAIYNAHSYHTKVPHEVIMRYILHYTEPGDIILDGFAGTGMTGVAASACGDSNKDTISDIEADFMGNGMAKAAWGNRHAICSDLSPICFHISSNYNSHPNVPALQKAVDELKDILLDRFGYFYEYPIKVGNLELTAHINYFVWSEIVSCNNCGQELNVHDLSYDYEGHVLHSSLKCPNCGTIQKRTEAYSINETTFDARLGKTVSQLKYKCCLLNYSIPKHGRGFSRDITEPKYPDFIGNIPTVEIKEGDKFSDPKRVGANYISQMYFKRTSYVLAYLYEQIHTTYKSMEKPLMFIFTSMLPKLTRMNRYMPQHGSRALVGPMANTLYIPPQCVENNPIDQFVYQAGKVIRAFEQCHNGNAIQISSATNLPIPDNSIDYVFTDPPFGANIMYSELNVVPEAWLNVMTNNKEEAISNKSQHKGLLEYQGIMTACFKEYYRVLKAGKWLTVEFSNTSAACWNSLQYAIKSAGFIISCITELNKERGGLHAMLGPTAVKQDLAISCFKPSMSENAISEETSKASLWEIVSEYLSHTVTFLRKEGKTIFISDRDPRIIYDRIISYYIQHGWPIPIDAKDFQDGLRQRFIERDGMFFTASQALQYEEQRAKTTEFVSLALIVSSEAEGIAWLNRELGNKPQTYQELQPEWMKAMVTPKKGDRLPELMEILEENFIKDDDDRWRKPDAERAADLEIMRQKKMAREFALYAEQASKPKAKRMKDCRLEVLRYGFKDCYKRKDYATIISVGDHIQESLLLEDEFLLQYYDNAAERNGME